MSTLWLITSYLAARALRQTAGPDCVPVTNRNKKAGCLPPVYQIGSVNFID
jgi:hypothetical protein